MIPLRRRLLEVLFPSSRGRAIFTLAGGTLFAQALAFLARPLLTRLYTPEAFGMLGFIFALVSVLSVASSGRYEDAIMLPERERRSLQVLFLSMGLSLALTCIILLFLLPLRETLAAALHRPSLASHMLWIPFALLLISWSRQIEVWLTRQRAFRRVTTGQIARQAIAVPAQIAGGFFAPGASALIGGAVAGYLAQWLILMGQLLRYPLLTTFRHTPFRLYLHLAYRYRNFPRFTLWANLLNTLSSQLPLFALMYFFVPSTVGHYALAYSTLTLPITLLGTAIARVFFVDVAEAYRKGTTAVLTRLTYRNLLLIGGFPVLSLIAIAPTLFAFVFGNEWLQSGQFAAWMAPWILMLFITSPLTYLIDVLEKQRIALYMTLALLGIRILALGLGGLLGSALTTVALYSLSSCMLLFVYLYVLARLGGVSSQALFQEVHHLLILSLPSFLILLPLPLIPSPMLHIGGWFTALLVYGWRAGRHIQWHTSGRL